MATQGCDKIVSRNLIKDGNALYRAGNYALALEKFEQAAKLEPDFPILQLHLGYSAMALASSHQDQVCAQKATAAFVQYMRLRPKDERGPKYYLQILLDSGHYNEARQFLEQRYRARPNDLKNIIALGMVNSRAGDFEQALKWYAKGADLQPKEPQPQYVIGTLCWKQLYKNSTIHDATRIKIADQGISALEKALKLQPDYVEALTYANLLYRERAKGQTDPIAKKKDLRKAELYYKRALELMKKNSV
ncbi:MAG: tetratricopeptide repeat protein [Pseudomonadota bacterium]